MNFSSPPNILIWIVVDPAFVIDLDETDSKNVQANNSNDPCESDADHCSFWDMGATAGVVDGCCVKPVVIYRHVCQLNYQIWIFTLIKQMHDYGLLNFGILDLRPLFI